MMAFELLVGAIDAGLATVLDYLSAHVLTCLIPAFFIAGAISALLQKETILKYFGAGSSRWICYPVAATSGTVLAVCSCTILPIFAGIERRGAGIGPATAFLFSGPAINLLAIILTARVLGLDLGIARALAAVSMAVVIGLIMEAIFERDRACQGRTESNAVDPSAANGQGGLATPAFLAVLVGILLIATSSYLSALPKAGAVALLILAGAHLMRRSFTQIERRAFLDETWWLSKKIVPLLLVGTFITGMIGNFLPVEMIRMAFGTNSLPACLLASIIGALLYMPTLLEVPIVGTLFGYSTGVTAPGPALALLLAGPSLSLPNMIVIWRVMGGKRTAVYIALVVIAATLIGMLYGALVS